MKRSKKYLDISKSIDFNKFYSIDEAMNLIKKTQITKFDATVECNLSLKLDPKKVDQNLKGALILPHGSGKKLKVVVLAKGLQAKEAEKAGADYVGDQDLIDRISKNWLDFDVLISTPEMMPSVSKLGSILGPRRLMPNLKLGTVTNNVFQLIQDIKKGRIEYRLDKNGNLHTVLGKASFEEKQLLENFKFLYEHLMSVKPKTSKSNFIKSITISTTMAPGIKVDFASI
ncbi:50S ribosomal protein L1 [Columbia Basin potato purple top phytoplasma]|uniref:Large ribosomal subunit protein uL1 n=1 Tax=Columbia Basin potato purple top phytoplasma TaxID=307134 RepID=A0ABT5L8Q0_9MOLU|nr:50S ribosomal protein L1 [Columbia Basin potato purple top phytoplasma]